MLRPVMLDGVFCPNSSRIDGAKSIRDGSSFLIGLLQHNRPGTSSASAQWSALQADPAAKAALIAQLEGLGAYRSPYDVYALVLFHLFANRGEALDEEQIVKSATGIRSTVVWKKLFKFQRDGVVGALDKLNRYGGCIIADSVGLGKTFEALAIIKYHELRNDRVLVLCPKRLRDNWNDWDPEGTDSREDPFDDEPIDDDFELEVTTDGPVVETFAWAPDEPEVHCEVIGVMHRISAKARVFAKHEHGPVFGEDW